jgi:hypothetical protein
MNRNPDVDRWLDGRQHPLDAAMRRARDIILVHNDVILTALGSSALAVVLRVSGSAENA